MSIVNIFRNRNANRSKEVELSELLGQEVRGRHGPAEHRVGLLHGRFLLLLGERSAAVCERHNVVSLLVRRSHCGPGRGETRMSARGRERERERELRYLLNAAVGQEPPEHDVLDLILSEHKVEVGGGESIQPPLALHHHVPLLRCELVTDGPAPLARLEAPSLLDAGQDPVGLLAQLSVVIRKGDRGMNDLAALQRERERERESP